MEKRWWTQILDAYIDAGLPRTNFTEQAQDAQSRIECALATLKVMAASYRPQVADDLDANTLTRVADKLEAVFDAWAQAQQIATDERERRTLEGAR